MKEVGGGMAVDLQNVFAAVENEDYLLWMVLASTYARVNRECAIL
jgi:hypothetical protein